ncbi:otopetrin-2-like isoform X1 [Limulus polyphemus]|uniref:Otopetrin-2-like isoform X1 n=2 Tax=Limulus polyphemus TaxID=6850 RepID=A0ABM1SEB5_LIMPO|nr:otopetrin-2-like isoform X1 [Limulus polyphemus]
MDKFNKMELSNTGVKFQMHDETESAFEEIDGIDYTGKENQGFESDIFSDSEDKKSRCNSGKSSSIEPNDITKTEEQDEKNNVVSNLNNLKSLNCDFEDTFSISQKNNTYSGDRRWSSVVVPMDAKFFSYLKNVTENILSEEEMKEKFRESLSVLLSSIYCVFLVTLGAVLALTDQEHYRECLFQIFNTVIACLGLSWLVFFNVDLQRYKKSILSMIKQQEDIVQDTEQEINQSTSDICNQSYNTSDNNNTSSYRFLMGRHSGSFYLKVGMAAFCFGHLIHEGLQLGQHVLSWSKQNCNCVNKPAVVVHIITPIFSFYQLFIAFKYSNIIINRYQIQARFGLMHLIGTSLCNWFNTLVQDAAESHSYTHESVTNHSLDNSSTNSDFHYLHGITNETSDNDAPEPRCCYGNHILLSPGTLQMIPYLYPFTIEYSLLLAGVWFILWQNIGRQHSHANPHPFHQKIDTKEGIEEVNYQSNLFISADCHASNKGLFAGLFLVLISIITVIIFFVAMSGEKFVMTGITVHTLQEGILTGLALIAVLISFRQTSLLDINLHPITFLDDVLMFIPLPFFFVNGFLSIMADSHARHHVRVGINVLIIVQVVVQTVFIIDGLRRCSNSHALRYKKPGRELITFLIICNLSMWIVNTFEHKSVENYHEQTHFFGSIWSIVSHATLPLMLFYRFHASVCLADIWKSGYEKGE